MIIWSKNYRNFYINVSRCINDATRHFTNVPIKCARIN